MTERRFTVGDRVEIAVPPRTGWCGEVIETSGRHSVRVHLDEPVTDLGGAQDFWYHDSEVVASGAAPTSKEEPNA